MSDDFESLHESSAEHGDGNHWQPRWHLCKSPHNIANRDVGSSSSEETIKWMPDALIRCSVRVLGFGVQFNNIASCRIYLVQWDKANSCSGLRLVGQWLREQDVHYLRWANGPRVAEDLLSIAVDAGKLRRGSGCFQKRNGFLSQLLAVSSTRCFLPCYFSLQSIPW